MDILSYALSKKYTNESLDGVGALKGKNATIESIEPITVDGVEGNRITFKWVGDSGTEYTDTLDVMNGLGIKSVQISDVNNEKHLIVTYDDDTTEDAGKLPSFVQYPELTNPSAELSTSNNTLLECGSTQNTTMVIAFDRGKIEPSYGTSGKRSGAAQSYTLDGSTQGSATFNIIVSEAKTTYRGSVAYAAGEQPKDSEGSDYDSPLAAGSVNTNDLEFEFVNAVWANTEHIDIVAKLPLISKKGGMVELDFPAQTSSDPEEFHLPSDWTNVVIYTRFPYGEEMQDVTSEFDASTVGHDDASGTEVTYTKYRDNRGYAADARTLLITWH